MARLVFFFASALALLAYASFASAEVVEHTFHVQNLTMERLCQRRVISIVNGGLPGPEIRVHEGDTLVVHVFNKLSYNLTIHWHGVFQLLSGWADGPDYITQCPISPGHSYTYRFSITQQEGTLWWHAHILWLRASVYGALIIRPRAGRTYPFPKPYREVPILLGEWWNTNVIDVENQALVTGGFPNSSNAAFTINGRPGDLYPCSSKHTYKLKVVKGKTYLLRIINAALNNQFFFKIANHSMKVVAVDACYTDPYITDVVLVAPGQTTDVLLTANQPPASYYMAASPYISALRIPVDIPATTGRIIYNGATSATPIMPTLPDFNDTPTAYKFNSNITGLVTGSFWEPPPLKVDEHMFSTVGLGLVACGQNLKCQGPLGQRLAGTMNNASFQLPTTLSMLQAFFSSVGGIYTTDFPDRPPVIFDYVNGNRSLDPSLVMTTKSTKVKKVKYNSTVEMVIQNTALIEIENHPMHLHGFNFHVLAQGFGNFDPVNDPKKFNLINPQLRNTVGVPVGGWVVIRFRANNPGIWFIHCHIDVHLPWGMGMAFEVENGPTPETTLPPPPADLPQC